MNPREIIEFLKPENFGPCVFVSSSGDRYTVRHPERARIMEGGTVYIFEPSQEQDAHYAGFVRLGSRNIAAIEPLEKEKSA